MLNPNGFYCFKTNVSVSTVANVEVHCNTQIANPDVSIEILSESNGGLAAIGVAWASQINFTRMNQDGSSCSE